MATVLTTSLSAHFVPTPMAFFVLEKVMSSLAAVVALLVALSIYPASTAVMVLSSTVLIVLTVLAVP